jgi:hypothetical protein
MSSLSLVLYVVTKLVLPSATGVVTLDYFAYEPEHARVWVPASNLGVVAIIDAKTDAIRTVGGFATGTVELRGKKIVVGPSSVAIGKGVVYVGNRGDGKLCAIDASTLALKFCAPIDDAKGIAAAPDAVVFVGTTNELWVTRGAPPLGVPAVDQAISIFDASDKTRLAPKGKLALGASAEGYVVDEKRGLFYTGLEESGETVAIDVKQRKIVSRWKSGCAEPHGVALDRARRFLFVACNDRVIALDAAHDGKVLASLPAGEGIDNVDYSESQKLL